MIDWNRIDTILLDMDGTLLDLAFDNFFWLDHLPRRYAEIHGTHILEASEVILERMAATRRSLEHYCYDEWSEHLGLDVPALEREVAARIGFRPGAIDFLEQVRAAGKHTVLLTNAHFASLDLKHEVTGIGAHVDVVHSSHAFGWPKESDGFWDALQERESISLASAVLFDDNEHVLDAAASNGVAVTIHMVQPDSTRPARSSDRHPGITHFEDVPDT